MIASFFTCSQAMSANRKLPSASADQRACSLTVAPSTHVMRSSMHMRDVTLPNANARDYNIFRNLNSNYTVCRCLQTASEQQWVAAGQMQVLLHCPEEH